MSDYRVFQVLTEFRPGRIDHHGFQILLFCLMPLAPMSTKARWSHPRYTGFLCFAGHAGKKAGG
jgi:hypothetical protein